MRLVRYFASAALALLLLSPCLLAQNTGAANTHQAAWSDHYRNATISIGNLETHEGKSSFTALGTGVLTVLKRDGKNIYAFATAKHVIEDPSRGWHPKSLQVRFASEERRPLNVDLGYTLMLTTSSGARLWKSASDGNDIAVIPVTPEFIAQIHTKVNAEAIGTEEFANDAEIYDGANLVLLGFPGDVSVLMGKDALVRAVTRSGIIAWTDPLHPGSAFLIDANILPGNSGGPVFSIPSGLDRGGAMTFSNRSAFLGIVSSNLSNKYVESLGSLGRVEPASVILALLTEEISE